MAEMKKLKQSFKKIEEYRLDVTKAWWRLDPMLKYYNIHYQLEIDQYIAINKYGHDIKLRKVTLTLFNYQH